MALPDDQILNQSKLYHLVAKYATEEVAPSGGQILKWRHLVIPHICNFFSTSPIFGSICLHAKARKSYQNDFPQTSDFRPQNYHYGETICVDPRPPQDKQCCPKDGFPKCLISMEIVKVSLSLKSWSTAIWSK